MSGKKAVLLASAMFIPVGIQADQTGTSGEASSYLPGEVVKEG